MLTELATGVFSFASRFVEANAGLVLGTRAALIIDAPFNADEALALAAHVRRFGHTPNRLQLTHGHGDHIMGAEAFPQAEVFAHTLTPLVMRDHLARWAAASDAMARVSTPTVLSSCPLTHDLGGRRVTSVLAPGHSPDGQALWVEQERVLFAGDTATTGILPALEWGESRALETSQRALAAFDIAVLVPGHGSVVYGAQAAREWLCWMADYIATTRTMVNAALQHGESDQQATAHASYAACVGNRFDPARNNMPARHAKNVAHLIREERGAE